MKTYWGVEVHLTSALDVGVVSFMPRSLYSQDKRPR